MTNFFASYPPTIAGQAVPTYANLAAFPSAVTAGNGALAIALDTDTLYISNGTVWEAIGSPSTVLSIGTFDSEGTPSANALTISANALIAQSADATHPGMVNTSTQTFAGVKTFSSNPIMSGLTASQAVVTDGSKALASLGYATAATASTLVERDSSANINIANANVSALTASQAVVTDASKNLASLAYTTAATATTLAERDSNANIVCNNIVSSSVTVVSAGGTTNLTPGSSRVQILTGTLNQTFKLPNANTLAQSGATFEFNNNSTGVLTVQDFSAGAVTTIPSGGYARVICTDTGSAAGVWDKHFLIPANGSYGTAGMTVTGTLAATSTVTGTQLISSVSTGTAPLSVSSTTKVANLYVDRAALADTVTTNANLTGDVTSVGNATTYNNTVPVNKGGTGLTSGTSGGVLAYTASGTLASSGALTANQLVIGGGAGVVPSSLAAGLQYQVLTMGASNPGYGAVNLSQSAAVTGTLPGANVQTSSTGNAGVITTKIPTVVNLTNPIYTFVISSASATAGATYTNNGNTFQLLTTISASLSAVMISISGGAPAASGTLTGLAGASNITFSSQSLTSGATSGTYTPAAGTVYLEVEMVGGGGGASGGGTGASAGSNGSAGGNTTFSDSTAGGGGGANVSGVLPGAGGVPTIGSISGQAFIGGTGALSGATGTFTVFGALGGSNGLGGAVAGNGNTGAGYTGMANTGAGGGGGGVGSAAGALGGFGGGAGAHIKGIRAAGTYSYTIGAGGAGGAGGGGVAGGSGACGSIRIIEHYY